MQRESASLRNGIQRSCEHHRAIRLRKMFYVLRARRVSHAKTHSGSSNQEALAVEHWPCRALRAARRVANAARSRSFSG